MPLTQLAPPYPIFTDKSGLPLNNGYLYFGTANLNPETNPITVYYDSALTQPAAQPLRTSNGYVMRNGSPAIIYANSQFSVTVRDKNRAMVIYSPVGYGITPGTSATITGQITYNQGGTGAVNRVLTSRLQDYISVKDFGVVGDGTTDDTAAFNAARAAARAAKLPLMIYGTPRITSQLLVDQKEHWIFDGFLGNISGSRPSSYLIKASSVSGALVWIIGSATNTLIQYGGIVGEAGNTGDGYLIQANSTVLEYPYVEGVGQDGIRVGSDTPGSGINTNSVLIHKPKVFACGRHGIYLSDGDDTQPSNGNAGTLFHASTQSNSGDGIRVGNASWWSIINPLCQANSGYGIYLEPNSSISIFGGDSENNPGGNLFLANPERNKIYDLDVNGLRYSSLLDYGPIAPAINGNNVVLNPNFADTSIWKLTSGSSISGGILTMNASNGASQKLTTVKGNSYTLKVTVSQASNRGVIKVGSTGAGSFNILSAGYITGTGVYEYSFVALSENTWVQLSADVSATPAWGVSLVEVYGKIVSNGTIKPRLSTTALAPAYEKGAIYFDSTLNKLRVGGASGWETITST
jgi:hypothetical protein